ncbi:enoyl-CoA hydratase/isomerase family protein [Rothia sp. ARF10]|nr:enoyl-CoA hydratase/isomerase family protein [Rothia sp. ARF10]
MSVTLTRTDGVAHLVLDRPDKGNALNVELSGDIRSALEEAAEHPGVLVIESSTPGTFVSGADIADLRRRTRVEALARLNHNLFLAIEEYPWPTVAVVDGPALGGGCELALACDMRVTTTRSTWGLPEVTLGIIPSAGGMHRLPRIVGWGVASELILSGRRIDGVEAHRIGMANRVCDVDDLDRVVADLLRDLGRASSTATRYAKEAMRAPADRSRVADAALQALCFESEDARQRLDAFLERRARSRA